MAGLFTAPPPMAPTSPPQATNVPTTNGTQVANGPRGPPNSTLLFGFLVSFLALFIIFMVCGLGSRHYLDLRRRERRLHETSEEANPAELSSPEIWDVSIMPGEEKWKALMPLSVEVQRDRASKKADTSEALRAQQTLAYLAQLSVPDRFFYTCGEFCQKLITFLKHPPGRTSDCVASPPKAMTSTKSPTVDDVNLQISVVVAMPSPHSHRERNVTSQTSNDKHSHNTGVFQDDGLLPDIAIGVTKVPWGQELVDFG